MARARNIKPAFFDNDKLAEVCPLGRLLFIGLWTIADYKGDLEWRSKRVKAQLLPYDDCNIEEIAKSLDKSGFIRFYSDGQSIYVNITNFTKHQNPHKNEREKGSEIPEFSESMRQVVDLKELTINLDKSGVNHDENGSNPADSLILIPEPLKPKEENDRSDDQSLTLLVESGFQHIWKVWKETKKQIGKVDTSPKAETLKKKWKPMFNSAYFKKHTEQDFKDEINRMAEFIQEAHRLEGFNRFENMQLPKLLTEKQWRDE